jgi:hypothetical protein
LFESWKLLFCLGYQLINPFLDLIGVVMLVAVAMELHPGVCKHIVSWVHMFCHRFYTGGDFGIDDFATAWWVFADQEFQDIPGRFIQLRCNLDFLQLIQIGLF